MLIFNITCFFRFITNDFFFYKAIFWLGLAFIFFNILEIHTVELVVHLSLVEYIGVVGSYFTHVYPTDILVRIVAREGLL